MMSPGELLEERGEVGLKKYALLILAHTDPVHLRRLIYSLDYEHFDIYVHIDKKQDVSQFHFENYALNSSELFVIKDTVPIYWGDISIVNATLTMYREAVRQRRYERFITLSGLDYPLKSNEEIYNILSDPQTEYIMGNPLEAHERHKVDCINYMKPNFINKIFNKVTSTIYRKMRISFGTPELMLSSGEQWTFYFAPQWHALSFDFVEYMLSCLDRHPEILKRFQRTYAPDELVIPTILFNSAFKNHALQSDFPEKTHYNYKTAIHCLNFEPVIEVFDEKSFDMLVKSDKCFARKLHSNQSEGLIVLLDEHRNKKVGKDH